MRLAKSCEKNISANKANKTSVTMVYFNIAACENNN